MVTVSRTPAPGAREIGRVGDSEYSAESAKGGSTEMSKIECGPEPLLTRYTLAVYNPPGLPGSGHGRHAPSGEFPKYPEVFPSYATAHSTEVTRTSGGGVPRTEAWNTRTPTIDRVTGIAARTTSSEVDREGQPRGSVISPFTEAVRYEPQGPPARRGPPTPPIQAFYRARFP